jgi:hypothetical protein
MGSDLDTPGAGLSGQMAVEIFLQPLLADLESRRDEQGVAGLLIFRGGGRTDIADQMADRRPSGIMA